jgi:hypothetical protein
MMTAVLAMGQGQRFAHVARVGGLRRGGERSLEIVE